jgi:hypothetical protein
MNKKNYYKSYSSKSCLENLLKNCDYFGVRINFQIKNSASYKSIFGGFVFFCFFVFCITFFFSNFGEFITRKKLTLVYYQRLGNIAPQMNFNNYSMAFAIGLTLDGDPTALKNLSLSYFDISFQYNEIDKSKSNFFQNEINLNLTSCNYSHFFNKFNDSFDYLKLENYLCPDIKNFDVQGTYVEQCI